MEKIGSSGLEVVSQIKEYVNQHDVLEKINLALKLFFLLKKALVESNVEALLALVTHNKSAKTCSQADLLDCIC